MLAAIHKTSTGTSIEELGEGLKELNGPHLASMGGEALGPVRLDAPV